MTIKEHADRTETAFGLRAEDIHKWLDGYFDVEGFDLFLKGIQQPGFDPYEHRKHRHCREALEDAYKEFEESYTKDQIQQVFEQHIKDDYDGYIPCKKDFTVGDFKEKYHEARLNEEKIFSPLELQEYFKGRKYKTKENDDDKLPVSFVFRIVLPSVAALILFVVCLFAIVIPVFRYEMLENKKEMIKELVNTASSSVNYYIQREKQGHITIGEAKAAAAGEIRKMRYGIENKDYFFITDMRPRMVMHPYRKDLEGEDLSFYIDKEDNSGKYIFVEFVNIVEKRGEGYLNYFWQWMDRKEETAPKLSYVKGIPEWDWIIGTGIYINDVEEEIQALTNRLLIIVSIISCVIFLILLSVIYYSKKIESNRLYFQRGLQEAKDRYRALAEAATEGYVLEIDGENVYSNSAILRILGYSEEEISNRRLGDFLDFSYDINRSAAEHLQNLYNGKATPGEYEARFVKKDGSTVDVRLITSNLFFSQKNGHLILIKPVTGTKEFLYSTMVRAKKSKGLTTLHKDSAQLYSYINDIYASLEESTSASDIIQALERLPVVVSVMCNEGLRPEMLRQVVSNVYNNAVLRSVTIAMENCGKVPVSFSFISLGSNARDEMTIFSDQDNALIYEDTEKNDEAQIYFLKLSRYVTDILDRGGFKLCPGGIVAANPECCMSLSRWKSSFTRWFSSGEVDSILKINVFLDIKHVYGNEGLTGRLQSHIFNCAEKNPSFFPLYAQNALLYKVPLTVLGHIKTKSYGDKRVINIKECLKPLEIAARLYAVKNAVKEPGTVERLEILAKNNHIAKKTYNNTVYDFNYLWNLRFQNQLVLNADLSKINDDLDLHELSDVELENLKNILENISNLQNTISLDFTGIMRM